MKYAHQMPSNKVIVKIKSICQKVSFLFKLFFFQIQKKKKIGVFIAVEIN